MTFTQFIKPMVLVCGCAMTSASFAGHPGEMPGEMMHDARAVPEGMAVPSVSANVYVDEMAGINLHLDIENYQLQPPEHANQVDPTRLNGHAHLYVNQQKVARLYGPYWHITDNYLRSGVNVISVTLNDHNHNTWQVGDKDIAATVLLQVQPESEDSPRQIKVLSRHSTLKQASSPSP